MEWQNRKVHCIVFYQKEKLSARRDVIIHSASLYKPGRGAQCLQTQAFPYIFTKQNCGLSCAFFLWAHWRSVCSWNRWVFLMLGSQKHSSESSSSQSTHLPMAGALTSLSFTYTTGLSGIACHHSPSLVQKATGNWYLPFSLPVGAPQAAATLGKMPSPREQGWTPGLPTFQPRNCKVCGLLG